MSTTETAVPARRPLVDRLRGLLALLVTVALLGAIPVALVVLRGNPLIGAGGDWSALLDRLTAPDQDGSLFLAALTWLGWLAWASFALTVGVEAVAQLRGLPTPRLPALGPQQRAANVLVATAALLFTVPLLHTTPVRATTDNLDRPTAAPAAVSAALTAPNHDHAVHPQPRPAIAAAPARSYTVQPGDTLWQLATDQLGDGARFTEIAALNYGAPQADGHSLTSAHWLTPGWTLTLPADATPTVALPTAAGHQTAQTVVVEPGDTLWQIAQDRLGDGLRYHDIAAASTGLQADGARLVDPDLIRPGWKLTLPHTATPTRPDVPAAPDSARAPAPTEPLSPTHPLLPILRPAGTLPGATPVTPAGPVAAGQKPASRPTPPPAAAGRPAPAAKTPTARRAAASTPSAPTADPHRELVTIRTAGGVGALLAASLLVLLGVKRTRQQRRRRPGQRIAMPLPALQRTELELRLVEDPTGLARVDQALRSLSVLLAKHDRPLPDLRLVRLLDENLELYLAGASDFPPPFVGTGDPTIWTLPGDAPLPPPAELDEVPAPFPSLVTLGEDLDGAHLLLDLEHTAALSVDGEAVASVSVLAAIAAELATSRWADDLQVTVVGCLPGLPDAIGTGRLRHVETLGEVLPALESRAASTRQLMTSSDLPDLQHARSAGNQRAHAGAWYPEILLLGAPVDPADRARLDALLTAQPRISLAAVIATDPDPETNTADSTPSEWRLALEVDGPDDLAILHPLGLAVRPQRLSAEDLEHLLDLLAVADLPAETQRRSDPTTPALIEQEPSLTELGTQLISPTADDLDHDHAPHALRSGDPAAAQSEPAQDQWRTEPDPFADEPIGSGGQPGHTPEDPPPLVQVLGPVKVLHARGRLKADRRGQLTEIAAFIALHPGLDHSHLDEAKWPGSRNLTNTRNSAVSKLRRWLGTAPDGREYLPDAAAAGYQLHPDIRSDWDLWRDLLPAGPATASTHALAHALQLVKGQPFAGVNHRTYAWAERDRQEMISAIGDGAHELARRALLDGDATLARQAAAAGLQADPGAELLWRDALRAEWLAGDLDRLSSTADRLIYLADKLGDDLEPETDELLNELLSRSAESRPSGTP